MKKDCLHKQRRGTKIDQKLWRQTRTDKMNLCWSSAAVLSYCGYKRQPARSRANVKYFEMQCAKCDKWKPRTPAFFSANHKDGPSWSEHTANPNKFGRETFHNSVTRPCLECRDMANHLEKSRVLST